MAPSVCLTLIIIVSLETEGGFNACENYLLGFDAAGNTASQIKEEEEPSKEAF